MVINKTRFLPVLFCFLALVLAYGGVARAQTKESYTDIEKAGFAFHRLAGSEPDFKSWIFQSKKYNQANPVKKVEILQGDVYRLQNGFRNYAPDTDLITVNLTLMMKTPTADDVEGVGKNIKIHANFNNMPENYLPMQLGNLWVALVIKDFGRIADISFSPDEYTTLSRYAKYRKSGTDRWVKVRVEMKLRALSVDTSAPMTLEDTEMWLMLTEIGTAQLLVPLPGGEEAVWKYEAPWYVPADQKDLLRLYKN